MSTKIASTRIASILLEEGLLKRASRNVMLNRDTSLDELVTEFLNEAASIAFGGSSVEEVLPVEPGVFKVGIVQDDWNPEEPGETFSYDFTFLINLKMRTLSLETPKRARIPIDVWESSVQKFAVAMKRLSRMVPSPVVHEDSPSLQETHPWHYEEM